MAKKAKDVAPEDGEKKSKKEKKRGRKPPVDVTGRMLGSLLGVLVLLATGWLLFSQQIDVVTAGKLALVALVLALLTEKLFVPFGRALMGPPRDDEAAKPAAGQRRR